MASEPAFPPELERELFETTALMHPRTIPVLLRVARRVLTWIEPLLYRIVRVNMANQSMVRVLVDAMKTKPPDFFRKAVRHLSIETLDAGGCSAEDAKAFLHLCTRLTDLTIEYGLANPSLIPILKQMRLQRLGLELEELFGHVESIDLTHPLFSSVTHLDIFSVRETAQAPHGLSLLPALTHLCLSSELPREEALRVLEECARLQQLLVLWPFFDADRYLLAQTPHAYDIRFVIGQYNDYWGEWEAGARGRGDFWTRGDDFVARKRKGEIEATCYWLD
ncbi:hypothetical protein B0H14DRAFT_1197785 [Mycena olivaceomarginata]|nr:hypothetical protein B0H14DRAFT_1197785 [Mycena olivaceomarginata]